MPTANPLTQKPKTKRDKAHLQAVINQIKKEPGEFVRNIREQVVGQASTAETQQSSNQFQPQEKQLTPEQMQMKQKKDSSHMQAFQQELREIERLQKIRQRERDELRAQEDQKKAQLEQQKDAQQSQGIFEPVAKRARGMLGGMKKKVHDSERKVEMPKTPSN